MAEKKIHRAVEIALESTPRSEWGTSPVVSKALLECARTRGIVRQHMLKRGVSLAVIEDVLSEVAMVMQMKMLDRLERVEDVYFVSFRVSQLVVSNWGKKAINTSQSEEVSMSSLLQAEEDEGDVLERLSNQDAADNQDEENERRIDLDNAKRRFAQKLSAVGWPEDIKRERSRLGRPPKRNPVLPAE